MTRKERIKALKKELCKHDHDNALTMILKDTVEFLEKEVQDIQLLNNSVSKNTLKRKITFGCVL